MIAELSTAMLSEVARVLTSKLINSHWSIGTEDGKEILIQLNTPHIRKIYIENYVSKVLKMRTLWSDDEDVFLDQIYTPLTVTKKSKNPEKQRQFSLQIENGTTIKSENTVNIIGIAGHGKSTILRKLFLEELKKGDRIPFFIELRKVENGDILAHLRKLLEDLRLSLADGYIEYLLQSKKVVLLLDGFDEVSTGLRQQTLASISQLKDRFLCNIITSTRPNTELCGHVGIVNMYVNDLEKEDILKIISKLESEALADLPNLIESNISLRGTLVSPILVNLLCICYPHLDNIPDNVTDFYSALYMTLYIKHDKLKNFVREKSCDVSIKNSQAIFNSFCFHTLKENQSDFTEIGFYDAIHDSLGMIKKQEIEAEKVAKDIIEVTCLVQKDGYDNYVFLHKSIQEFYAALFVSTIRSTKKPELYQFVARFMLSYDNFDNMASYLYSLNIDDYNNYVVLEQFKKLNFEMYKSRPKEITKKIIDLAFKNTSLHLVDKDYSEEDIAKKDYDVEMVPIIEKNQFLTGLYFMVSRDRTLPFSISNQLDKVVFDESFILNSELFDKELAKYGNRIREHKDGTASFTINIITLFELAGLYDDFFEDINRIVKDIHENHYVPLSSYYDEADFEFDMALQLGDMDFQ
ncbi:NACHT domain-containing protein [Vibrio sp. ECSMB14105]|uniref:NACHT domain-containing protein n=1 Tax=Vibrio sp. ECSMB14105 TaxID=1638951 RepID=UPI000619365D|nr:NACHT domain-containing protein [Vibrio sp. ECSMB14105]